LPEGICNTSPIQYLHQLGCLQILPALARGKIVVPPAVVVELSQGRERGISLPVLEDSDWVVVRKPLSMAVLPLVTDLGQGETEVLALALEHPMALAVLDDSRARRLANMLHIHVRGTLGLLLDAKTAGLISTVAPMLDRLESLRFHLSSNTRDIVLRIAGEKA